MKNKAFWTSSAGTMIITVVCYVIIWGLILALGSSETSLAWFGILPCAYFGWKSLNRIQPAMFLWMSFVGWIVYFFIKLMLSIVIGLFVAPYFIGRWLAEKLADGLVQNNHTPLVIMIGLGCALIITCLLLVIPSRTAKKPSGKASSESDRKASDILEPSGSGKASDVSKSSGDKTPAETGAHDTADPTAEQYLSADGGVTLVPVGEAAPAAAIRPDLIPDEAVTFNGHSYMLYYDARSFDEAQKKCVEQGGHLATISSAEEDWFVYSYMVSKGEKNAYFGFTDAKKEGKWEWVTGEPITYTNWNANEPNSESSRENYAAYLYKYPDGTWNDADFGGSSQSYLCEWDYRPDAADESAETGNCVFLENLMPSDSARYTGNEGDSFIKAIGTRNPSVGVSGTDYEHGLEAWISRWNYSREKSWAWSEYNINGAYTRLTGVLDYGHYSYDNWDYTLYEHTAQAEILLDGRVVFSQRLDASTSYPLPIDIDVSGASVLRISVYDLEASAVGSSYLFGDLALTK